MKLHFFSNFHIFCTTTSILLQLPVVVNGKMKILVILMIFLGKYFYQGWKNKLTTIAILTDRSTVVKRYSSIKSK